MLAIINILPTIEKQEHEMSKEGEVLIDGLVEKFEEELDDALDENDTKKILELLTGPIADKNPHYHQYIFLSACNIENEVLVDTLLNDKQHLNPEHLSEIIKKELESDSDGPSDLNLIQHGYNIARNSANPDVLKTLQKSSLLNVPQDEYAADLFLTACRSNDAQKIKEHLPEKEIPKEKVEEAFRNLFKSRESIEAVKALLDSGLTPPEDSLSTACNYHHIDKDLLKLMIEWRGKDGNERLLPLDIDIHNVCDSDNVDLLKLLIETKTGLSSKDDCGYSNSLGINARLGALPIEIACLLQRYS